MKTPNWDGMLAARAENMKASEIRELLKLLDEPDIISFAGGIPDPSLLPDIAVHDAAARIFADKELAKQALQYAPSEGYLPLRQWLAGYMGDQGVHCGADNIVLTSGSQQALDLLAKLFLQPGRQVAVTSPTYLGAIQAFNAYEMGYQELNLTEPAFDETTSAAYVVPEFANPTGMSITLAERQNLIKTAADHGCAIIEDAAYRDLRFDDEPILSCLALDVARTGNIEESRVIYCGTFSKTLSPGLRVGWVCAAKTLIQKLVLAKQAADLHSGPLSQMLIHDLAQDKFALQVACNISTYRKRRDAMAAALTRYMPANFKWSKPKGGMFFWLEGPEGLDCAGLLETALSEARVAFVPGKAFFANGQGANTMRLNFSMNDDAVITEGVCPPWCSGWTGRVSVQGCLIRPGQPDYACAT